MGKLENQARKHFRKSEIQRAILKSVAIAGVLTVAMSSSNALGVLRAIARSKSSPKKWTINRSRERLLARGKLQYKDGYLRLTREGEAELRKLELNDFQLKRPKKWDKKWRVLIFDIPERRRSTRDKVRRTLRAIGFARLQDSVWVYPYDCEDLITLLKADFKVGKDLLYLIVYTIENDHALLDKFGLNR